MPKKTLPRIDERLLASWMAGMEALSTVARRKKMSREHLSRRLRRRWAQAPLAPIIYSEDDVLVLDAISCGDGVAFIIRAIDRPRVTWGFASRENAEAWFVALQKVRGTPRVVVSDHQKGLRLAGSLVFPDVLHQRCQAHVIRQALAWITKYPKTLAGRTLRVLALRLTKINREDEARMWTATLDRWYAHFKPFLFEKTEGLNGRWWYTHRYLRKATSLLLGCVPGVFTFTIAPQTPKTSNHVEGGLNSPLKEHLHRHRGLSNERQKALVAFFFDDWNQRNHAH
jgi:hypothetical protein